MACARLGRWPGPTSAMIPHGPAFGDSNRWLHEEVLPHEPALRAYLRAQFPDLPDQDDVVQVCLIRLLKVRAAGEIASPRGLLFAVARNAARDHFRRRKVANTFPITEAEVSSVFDEAPSVEEQVSRAQEAELLKSAISALPPRCREILLLKKYQNLSQREIARLLGISEHTVEAQLTKALRRCQEFFARQGLGRES